MSLKSDFIHFFMVYYKYKAPGQRQTAPRGQHFNVNKKALSLLPICYNLKKKISLKSDFIHSFL